MCSFENHYYPQATNQWFPSEPQPVEPRGRPPCRFFPQALIRCASSSFGIYKKGKKMACFKVADLGVSKNRGTPKSSIAIEVSLRVSKYGYLRLPMLTRWWFQTFLFSSRTLGKWSNLTNILQMGWNHQLVMFQGCRFVPQKHVRKQVATDDTKPDLNIGFQGLAAWFRAKIYNPVFFFGGGGKFIRVFRKKKTGEITRRRNHESTTKKVLFTFHNPVVIEIIHIEGAQSKAANLW